jgi:hypothetical protein
MSESTGPRRFGRRGHLAVLGCACALALSTCAPGFQTEMTETAGNTSSGESQPQGDGEAPPLPSLPDSEPVGGTGELEQSVASEAVEGGGDSEFEPIETHRPTVRLTGDEPATDDTVQAALEMDGVRFATAIRVGDLPMAVDDGPTTVETAVVEPHGFRVFTPQVTADATDVWERVAQGDVAFTHDTGHELGLELGERLPAADSGSVRVGAFASNGIPPVADAIMSRGAADDLGFEGDLEVLVSLHQDAGGEWVAHRLEEVTGLEAEPIELPATQEAEHAQTGQSGGVPAPAQHIEPFTYQSIGDGMIRINPGWVRRNVVSAGVPVFGEVLCHRSMIPQLRAALQEVAERGLDQHIRPGDYGGCWVPRHILFNPSRNLSMHAWGLAIDFNVSTNQYGEPPQMNREIVEVFEKWGFSWGGYWSTPDGMHFELRTLMNVQG